ncbi:MAG: L-seryl-tRNA(Sec) selenium transferase [Gemmatimonadales bacterium]|nr:MAG: L-seryl-tRNA(Sec) selenium transferase [Gemmatimonadales bacterium]
MTGDPRRGLPSLDSLLDRSEVEEWSATWGRSQVADALRRAVSESRSRQEATEPEAILGRALEVLTEAYQPGLRPVINGTGVVLHTNLGRAPLSPDSIHAITRVAAGYCNLEYEIETGARGDRYDHCQGLICELTGAQDAIVVNNNAAAVVLCVNEFALGRDVLVSRGELIEIGGSFRIPEMIERAGARLVEVGTTNRTRIDDYHKAISDATGLILKVHPANYRIEGFASSVGLDELVALGIEHDVPVAWDLGSAAPVAVLSERLQGPRPGVGGGARADLVMWSGDKLLGGPQAGIIHGQGAALARLRRNPLLRTYRVDKRTLAALEATLQVWRDPDTARARIPIIRMLSMPAEEVRDRANVALELLPSTVGMRVTVEPMDSLVGGGSAPGETIASAGWVIDGPAGMLDSACRAHRRPLIGRVSEGQFRLDFRCIAEDEVSEVIRIVSEALAEQ